MPRALKFTPALFPLLLPFLLSCGSDEGDTTTINEISTVYADTKGDLLVSAYDAVSGNPIAKASFFLPLIDSVPRESNGTDGTIYRDLAIGENYSVRAEAEGYAPVSCRASIKLAANAASSNLITAENAFLSIPLRKLSSSLRGSAFYQNLSNPLQTDLQPAGGANMAAIIQDEAGNCAYEQKTFAAQVGGDGFYSFDSLPEAANFTLIAKDAILNGLLYSGTQIEGTLGTSGSAAIMPRIIYDKVQTSFGFVINSDNRTAAEKSDTLIFGFSEPVNVSMLRNGDLAVTRNRDGAQTAADFIWGDTNRVLKIFPALGEWESAQTYTVRLKLYSILSSKIIDTSLVYLVNEFSDLSGVSVKGFKASKDTISHNTNSVPLIWKSVANAEYYEIYGKVSSKFDVSYSLLGTASAKTKGVLDTIFSLPTQNWFLNGDSASVLISAVNGRGKSAFGEPLILKDNARPEFSDAPKLTPDTANYISDISNILHTASSMPGTAAVIAKFKEPMDTTAILSVAIPEQTPREIAAEWKWNSEIQLTVTFAIGIGGEHFHESPIDIPIAVYGLQDKSGNAIYTKPVGAKSWENLLIILHADANPQDEP